MNGKEAKDTTEISASLSISREFADDDLRFAAADPKAPRPAATLLPVHGEKVAEGRRLTPGSSAIL